MFGWFDPVKRLERKYRKEMDAAHRALHTAGDRALYAELLAKAEATGDRLAALRAERGGAAAP